MSESTLILRVLECIKRELQAHHEDDDIDIRMSKLKIEILHDALNKDSGNFEKLITGKKIQLTTTSIKLSILSVCNKLPEMVIHRRMLETLLTDPSNEDGMEITDTGPCASPSVPLSTTNNKRKQGSSRKPEYPSLARRSVPISLDQVLKSTAKKTRFNSSQSTTSPSNKARFVRPRLDKHQITGLVEQLGTVSKPYPHYDCQGCDICIEMFKTQDVTRCAKKHGGNPCNSYGLYPHASKTQLSVAHVTKKVLVHPLGFENPLSNTLNNTVNAVARSSPSPHSQTTNVRREDNIKSYQMDEGDIVEVKAVMKARNALFWKVRTNSPDSLLDAALQRFRNLKKSVPHYEPPSWATCCAKVLFQTGSKSDARATASVVESRQASHRLNKRLKGVKRPRTERT